MGVKCHANSLCLIPYFYAPVEAGVLKFNDIAATKHKACLIFTHKLILAFVVVLSFDIAVLVDNVVKGINCHRAAKTYENISNHFINLKSPFNRGDAVSIYWIEHIEVQEVKLLFLLIKRRLDESGVWEYEMLVESCVKFNVHLQSLSR